MQPEERRHCRTRHRLYAEALSERRPAGLNVARKPAFVDRRARPRCSGWGILSANIIPTYSVASHWAIYSKAHAETGKRAVRRKLAGLPQRHGGAERRGSATTACSATRRPIAISLLYPHGLRPASDCSRSLKPRSGHVGRSGERRGDHRGLYPVWLAQDHARQAGRLPRRSRAVRYAVDDRTWTGSDPTKRGSASRCSSWLSRSCRKFRQHVLAQAAE